MKISLAQMDTAWENKAQNLLKCEQLIAQAAGEGADLILFPEMTLTGFSMNVTRTGEEDAFTVDSFSQLARQYQLNIGFGYVRHDTRRDICENMFCVVSRDGTLCGEYAKVHPFSYSGEERYFTGGNHFTTIALDGLCCGLSICYDLRFPEGFQVMSGKAHCILLIANWPHERRGHWLALTRARAIENQCYVIAVNRCGSDPQHAYAGDSIAVDPNGNILAQCGDKEQLITVEADKSAVEALRSRFPVAADRKPMLYAREYESISDTESVPAMSLKDKVVVVTGGCGLIGKKILSQIARLGGTAVAADIDEHKAAGLAGMLRRQYCVDTDSVSADITSEESVKRLVEHCVGTYGRIDALVNSAYPRNKAYGAKYEDILLENWKENVDMHLNGSYNVVNQVSKQMIRQGHGKIVMMGSIYGVVGPDFAIYQDTPMTMPAEYAAIKGALINLTRYLASYLGKYNITVNCVSPGGIFDHQNPVFVDRYEKKVPLGRMGLPGDIAGGIAWLLSDAADYVTGHNLIIDGGWSCI